MSMKLPTYGFKWLTGGEMEKLFNNRVIQVWEKNPCILEVDLEYPEELHDLHNDYPLCPERVKCKNGVEKLIPNLRDKTKYIIHYKNLIQCLKLGMKLKKIHRGLKFVESEWMKPYIDMNTKLRAKTKNNFEKDFYKLMNNSVFGKTMENIRNRVNVKLVNTEERARKLISKPNFRSRKIFSENLISVHMKKTSLTMNKPVYLGMCILDLSKTISSVYMGILGQLFYPIFAHFSQFFQPWTTFQNFLNILKKTTKIYHTSPSSLSSHDISNQFI